MKGHYLKWWQVENQEEKQTRHSFPSNNPQICNSNVYSITQTTPTGIQLLLKHFLIFHLMQGITFSKNHTPCTYTTHTLLTHTLAGSFPNTDLGFPINPF